MKSFTQYLIEKIEMKAPPEQPVVTSDDDNRNINTAWTTSKGNKIYLVFEPDLDKTTYDVSFTVNGRTTEDITRSPDREILQTILHQIKKTIDDHNITKFSFEAWSDSLDVKNISKLVRPYYIKLSQYNEKYKSDYSVSGPLYRILRNFADLHRNDYLISCLKQINTLLSYTDLDDDLRKFLESFKIVIDQIMDINDSNGSKSNTNRRLVIYKRFLSQYLGPEWKISPKGKDSIVATKNNS